MEKTIIERLTSKASKICKPNQVNHKLAKSIVIMCSSFYFPKLFEDMEMEILAIKMKELVSKGQLFIYYDRMMPSFVPLAYVQGNEAFFASYKEE